MEPASRIISLLDGLTVASDHLDLSVHTVKKWRRPKNAGGTGGFIPREHQFEIHCLLLSQGISVTAEDIVYSPEQRRRLNQLKGNLYSNSPSDVTDAATVAACSAAPVLEEPGPFPADTNT